MNTFEYLTNNNIFINYISYQYMRFVIILFILLSLAFVEKGQNFIICGQKIQSTKEKYL